MNISIHFLREERQLERAFREDGWTLAPSNDRVFQARHVDVTDEKEARSRLHRLGLLTSSLLRISFPPSTRMS